MIMRRFAIRCVWALTLAMFADCTYGDFITFSNSSFIAIPSRGNATPYPTPIDVSGVSGGIGNVTLTLTGVSHTYPDDLAAAVVSPAGTAVLLFSGPGTGIRASDLTWTFDDNAAAMLPEEGPVVSGVYKPGLFQWDDSFPDPGPGFNYGLTFQPFRSENVNGQWRLFVIDSNSGDSGSIAQGWSVSFQVSAVPEPGTICLSLMAMAGVVGSRSWRKRRAVAA